MLNPRWRRGSRHGLGTPGHRKGRSHHARQALLIHDHRVGARHRVLCSLWALGFGPGLCVFGRRGSLASRSGTLFLNSKRCDIPHAFVAFQNVNTGQSAFHRTSLSSRTCGVWLATIQLLYPTHELHILVCIPFPGAQSRKPRTRQSIDSYSMTFEQYL